MQPTFDHLGQTCLFCSPAVHGQEEQVILDCDSLYLFAGLGAITDGYVIITPYRCDDPARPAAALAELPPEGLDELAFLRAVVAAYYADRHGHPGMSFEHGRAGACLADAGGTRHCYHGHLCCYPAAEPLWEEPELRGRPALPSDRCFGLSTLASGTPYLFVERASIDGAFPADHVQHVQWGSRVIALSSYDEPESQLLRRLLARRVGAPEAWDWRAFPRIDSARALVDDFRAWLREPAQAARYEVTWTDGRPRLHLVASMVKSTRAGNDVVAPRYGKKWGGRLQHGSMGRFMRLLPAGREGGVRVLDAGCGPGDYARAFAAAGLRAVGADLSGAMLEQARQTAPAGGTAPAAFAQADVLHLPFRDGAFDGVWLSAVWVHVPRAAAGGLLRHLRGLLAPDGILYLSAQIGSGTQLRREGRVFVYYSDEELRRLFRAAELEVAETWTDVVREGACGDTRDKNWRHYLLKRIPVPAAAEAPDAIPGEASDAGDSVVLLSLGEREIVRAIQRWLDGSARSDRVVLGAGDDCAALRVRDGSLLVATTDHCPTPVIAMLGDEDPWYRGWYSMVISLSDLASMGAEPLGMLLAVEAPRDMELFALHRFYEGVLEASRRFGCPIVGGNLREGPALACVSTALGEAEPARLLRRDAARPGEAVVIIGEMGLFWAGAAARLGALRAGEAHGDELERNLRQPVPRLREAARIAELGLSRCAIDCSDGPIAAFTELAGAAPGVDVHVDLRGVRVHPAVQAVAEEGGIDLSRLLLAWGDWQLLCTCEPARVPELQAAMAALGCPAHRVGWVTSGTGRAWYHAEEGTGPLEGLPNERFTRGSYFLHTLQDYLDLLRETPLSHLSDTGEPR